jgi:hypothetical protein
MWIFAKSGFFSAVQHFDDANLIHVRARFRGDLERLCEANDVAANVAETPSNDYPFRMDFERSVWRKIVADEAGAVDYSNFKSAVHDGTSRDRAYMDVWAALRRAEEPRR